MTDDVPVDRTLDCDAADCSGSSVASGWLGGTSDVVHLSTLHTREP